MDSDAYQDNYCLYRLINVRVKYHISNLRNVNDILVLATKGKCTTMWLLGEVVNVSGHD